MTDYFAAERIPIELLTLIIIIALWEIVWKGIGLWRAARTDHKAWFIAILIINSAGILPIVYLLIQRNRNHQIAEPPTTTESN